MRILNIATNPSNVPNPRLNHRSQCAHCRRSYVFRRGILARIEHGTEIECDEDGCRYLKRGVKLYSYHSLKCFVAMIEPSGHA
ncbi:hypothetical protein DC522_30890 [Microvirga sp. KLBC 81]|nr:hypothetical protein DC522_30890 [Microvirga sp. KLBC 81]